MAQHAEQRHHNSFMVRVLLNFCEKGTIAVDGNLENAVKAAIIVSSSTVKRPEVCKRMMENQFMDWNVLDQSYPQDKQDEASNALGNNVAVWLTLMRFVSFRESDTINEHTMRKNYPRLYGIWNALRECKVLDTLPNGGSGPPAATAGTGEADVRDRMNFDDVCKLYILTHIIGLTVADVADNYIAQCLPKKTTLGIQYKVLGSLAETTNKEVCRSSSLPKCQGGGFSYCIRY